MNRRNFVRLIGGGTLGVATLGLSACASTGGSEFPAEAVKAWNGPPAHSDPRRTALAYAITAPNPHNLQPWLVDLQTPGEIWIYTDPTRLLPRTDPLGRQILIGHGAFIELLSIALAEQGFASELQLWPRGEMGEKLVGDLPIARVVIRPGAQKDPLFPQILLRRTPKTLFDTNRAVSPDSLSRLMDAAGNPFVRVQGTVEATRLARLRALCIDSAKVEISTHDTMMESVRLIRVGPTEILQHRDGISINSMQVRLLDTLGMFDRSAPPAPGTSGFKIALKRFEDHSQSAMGFLWMSTEGNSRTEQIEAGRAFLRLQLTATALGVGVHPMSQALQEFVEMKPYHQLAHQLLLGRAAPSNSQEPVLQMFCRLGYSSTPVSTTPRRPMDVFIKV